jgi:tetratricopeptide (TPR) repeat protein
LAASIRFSRSTHWIPSAFLLLTICAHAVAGQTAHQPTPASADALLRAGVTAQQRGDNRSAIDDFQKALAIQPGMIEAHAGLGAALAATGQFDAAIDEDMRVLAAAPDNAGVRTNLGMAYYKKGDLAHARQQFETMHLASPRDVHLAVMLGYVYIKLGREAEAVDLLSPLEPANKDNMDLEYLFAYSLIQSGKGQDGVPLMEKVAQATHRADAYVIAGSTRLQRLEMDSALPDLEAAMRLDSTIPGLATMIGQADYALGNMSGAALSYQKALRADPRDFDANIGLGAIRLKEKNYESARPLLELALSLRPTVPLARLELAKLDDATGRYTEAVATLEELVKAEPNYFDAHWELANAYFQLDRPQDGKRERMIAQQILARQHNDDPVAK